MKMLWFLHARQLAVELERPTPPEAIIRSHVWVCPVCAQIWAACQVYHDGRAERFQVVNLTCEDCGYGHLIHPDFDHLRVSAHWEPHVEDLPPPLLAREIKLAYLYPERLDRPWHHYA